MSSDAIRDAIRAAVPWLDLAADAGVVLIAYRYGVPDSTDCDSVLDAILTAVWMIDDNAAAPVSIEVAGDTILERSPGSSTDFDAAIRAVWRA